MSAIGDHPPVNVAVAVPPDEPNPLDDLLQRLATLSARVAAQDRQIAQHEQDAAQLQTRITNQDAAMQQMDRNHKADTRELKKRIGALETQTKALGCAVVATAGIAATGVAINVGLVFSGSEAAAAASALTPTVPMAPVVALAAVSMTRMKG